MALPLEPLLTYLRSQTAELHALLDARPLAQAVLDECLDVAGYTELIRWQYTAHLRAETGLADFAWPTEYRYHARLPVLQREQVALPTGVDDGLAAPQSVAEATGRAYVLCGSALGGNRILSHLMRTPGLADFAPFPFYSHLREAGIAEWKAFTAFAKTRHWTPAEQHQAGEAAIATVRVFAKAGNGSVV